MRGLPTDRSHCKVAIGFSRVTDRNVPFAVNSTSAREPGQKSSETHREMHDGTTSREGYEETGYCCRA
jgi:hypothetical protein